MDLAAGRERRRAPSTCRLDDILTEPRGYDDWEVTLVDWMLTLGPKYRPKDLVSVSRGQRRRGSLIREVAIDDLRAMAEAARDNGTPIKVLSPFRGYKQQVALFYDYAGRNLSNFESAITYSARPGHSRHRPGPAIDFGSLGDTGLSSTWEVDPEQWLDGEERLGVRLADEVSDGEKDAVCYRLTVALPVRRSRDGGRHPQFRAADPGVSLSQSHPGRSRVCQPPAAEADDAREAPVLRLPRSEPDGRALSPGCRSAFPDRGGLCATRRLPAGCRRPGPSPTSHSDRALPIGVALVVAVFAMLGFVRWRSSRRGARYR